MASTTVTVYRNGDATYPGKRLVVNRRQIRTMDALLDKVTKDVKLRTAARTIKTPTGRHTITQLDNIQSGGCYVAVGPEGFKRLPYTEIKVQAKYTPKKDVEITPVKHSRLQMSARARKVADAEPSTHKIIFVYRNGDDLYPSCKMLLDKRALNSMDNVLKVVTNKVRLQSGAVFWLFTMEGKEIKEPSELENGGQYVAVGHGKKFKRVAYNDQGSSLTPRSKATTKNQRVSQLPKPKTNRAASKNTEPKANKTLQRKMSTDGSSSKASTVQSPRETHPIRRSLEEQEELIQEEVQFEYISEPPIQLNDTQNEPTGQQPLRLKEISQSLTDDVYKASGKEQEKAREVQDDKDVKEDKPIDQLPAEEVDEEEVDEEEIEDSNDTENNNSDNSDEQEDVGEKPQDNQ